MIAIGAHANGRTNRSHAIIESDATKSAAPAPAATFPVANAVASMAEMTTM